MKILVDADSCPVTQTIEAVACEKGIPVILFSDYNHKLYSEYSQIVTVEEGKDAADMAVFNHCEKGDLVITKDLTLASLVLGKGARAISPTGKVYRAETIDCDLAVRNLRCSSRKTHKRNKNKAMSAHLFEKSFRLLLC